MMCLKFNLLISYISVHKLVFDNRDETQVINVLKLKLNCLILFKFDL